MSSPCVPASNTSPWCNTIILSACLTVLSRWAMTMVVRSRRFSSSAWRMLCSAAPSRLLVASSRMRTGAFLSSARAGARRCALREVTGGKELHGDDLVPTPVEVAPFEVAPFAAPRSFRPFRVYLGCRHRALREIMEDCVTKFDEYAPPLVDIAPPDVRTRLYFGKLLINHPDAREAVCEGEGRVKPRGDNDPAGLVGVAPPAVLVNRAGPSPLRT